MRHVLLTHHRHLRNSECVNNPIGGGWEGGAAVNLFPTQYMRDAGSVVYENKVTKHVIAGDLFVRNYGVIGELFCSLVD